MNLVKTNVDGLVVLNPIIFNDQGGSFIESYNKKNINKLLGNVNFVQDNESESFRGVLRGLHFQNPPFEQGKLIRVISGAVLDFAIDIRKNSATYGQHFSVVLNGDNKTSFWIPPGFAHGFITLEDDTIFTYKCTGVYNKESEGSIVWNDKDLNIDWGWDSPIVSDKDQDSPSFSDLKTNF